MSRAEHAGKEPNSVQIWSNLCGGCLEVTSKLLWNAKSAQRKHDECTLFSNSTSCSGSSGRSGPAPMHVKCRRTPNTNSLKPAPNLVKADP